MQTPIQRSLAALLLSVAVAGLLPAQSRLTPEDLRVISGSGAEKNYQDMLFNYLLREADRATQRRLTRFEGIRSEADFKNWQEANRQKFLELIGGLPAERTPLNARVVGEVVREGYVVRKVIFESLPEFYVTANLYVPTVGKPPYPAVLSPCGHSPNGKAYDAYQHLFIGLAERGYVVLTYDPLGQGERIQYWDFLSGRRRFKFNQHGMAGIQEYLLGQNLARYFIWDGMRALDYLTSLPEVDVSRVGATGSSGGGTLTTYISMLDPRVKVSSIVTFITSIPKKIENRINDSESDPEQDVAGLLAAGIDHTDFLGMIAPRPVLIGAATRDFFPIEGARRTFAETQKLYRQLGVPERIKMVEFDHKHMYSQPLRESTYAWFDRWLKGIESNAPEPAITTEKDEALQCTADGQVLTSLGGKTVYDFNRAEAETLARRLEEKRRDPAFHAGLLETVRDRLGSQPDLAAAARHRPEKDLNTEVTEKTASVPSVVNAFPSEGENSQKPQKLGESEIDDLIVEKYLLTSEPGIVVPVRVIFPRSRPSSLPSVVYLRDRTGESDSAAMFGDLARQGRVVAVADVRGFGETMSPQKIPEAGIGYFDPRDGMDADFTFASFFLGQTLLGMRVHDARAVIDYMRGRLDVAPTRLTIAGRGWAGVVALFAAATDPGVSSLAVEGIPVSFAEIAAAKLYNQPVSLMLPGALQDFDLPDVFASLAPRPLLVLNPQDAMTRKMTEEKARQSVQPVREAYKSSGAEGSFQVETAPLESESEKALVKWIAKH
ncbi:MAG: acetylxylan esterase [Terriglobia bacterium]